MIIETTGDATYPEANGSKFILHSCTNQGHWGNGFTSSISKRWSYPEQMYFEWMDSNPKLGEVQIVPVEEDIFVCNILAQKGLVTSENPVQVDYDALALAFKTILNYVIKTYRGRGNYHVPYLIGGGDEEKTYAILKRKLATYPHRDRAIYVYKND